MADGGGRSGGGAGVVALIGDERLVILVFTREDDAEAVCMAVTWLFLWSIGDGEIGGEGEINIWRGFVERGGQGEGLVGDETVAAPLLAAMDVDDDEKKEREIKRERLEG
ncbi:hypothetical protein FXO37_14416 [Capsicum annuum]|nr:hypothetical protein FXO37_14416 [Capsicum annuum]